MAKIGDTVRVCHFEFDPARRDRKKVLTTVFETTRLELYKWYSVSLLFKKPIHSREGKICFC